MYGIEKLEEFIKKRRTGYTVSLVCYLSVLAVSIAVLATLSGYIALFILSLIGIIFSCSALVALRKRKPAHLTGRTYVGKISEVSVTASTKDTVKGSYHRWTEVAIFLIQAANIPLVDSFAI